MFGLRMSLGYSFKLKTMSSTNKNPLSTIVTCVHTRAANDEEILKHWYPPIPEQYALKSVLKSKYS